MIFLSLKNSVVYETNPALDDILSDQSKSRMRSMYFYVEKHLTGLS